MSHHTTTIELYQDLPICFRADDAWVNLTSLCKVFGKPAPYYFLRLPATKTFIAALEQHLRDTGAPNESVRENRVLPADAMEANSENHYSVFMTLKGGSGLQGTWAHPDLALECARWISPEFAIWCNQVVRKILSGEVELPSGPRLALDPDTSAKVRKVREILLDTLEDVKEDRIPLRKANAIIALASQFLRSWQLALENHRLVNPAPIVLRQLPAY